MLLIKGCIISAARKMALFQDEYLTSVLQDIGYLFCIWLHAALPGNPAGILFCSISIAGALCSRLFPALAYTYLHYFT